MYFTFITIAVFTITKEFIVINDDVLIYCVFLGIFFMLIRAFNFLNQYFNEHRSKIITLLNVTTLATQKHLIDQYNYSLLFVENYFVDPLLDMEDDENKI